MFLLIHLYSKSNLIFYPRKRKRQADRFRKCANSLCKLVLQDAYIPIHFILVLEVLVVLVYVHILLQQQNVQIFCNKKRENASSVCNFCMCYVLFNTRQLNGCMTCVLHFVKKYSNTTRQKYVSVWKNDKCSICSTISEWSGLLYILFLKSFWMWTVDMLSQRFAVKDTVVPVQQNI
jgi:hypothetical protein